MFRQRLAAGQQPVLADRVAAVLFDFGDAGQWTLTLNRGTPDVRRGSIGHPTTVIRTAADTFTSIMHGQESGAAAFLDGRLAIEVTDDGVGGAAAERGSGLRGLADRVEALGGELALDSPPGAGTRLAAGLPLT